MRSEGKCSYCTINVLNSSCTENTVTVLYCTQKCCCGLLKPKQRTDIFSVLTLNSIQCFSCFQLQFTHCPLISVKPGELLKVPHKSLRKIYALCCKIWPSMCHVIALLCKAAVFLCCGLFLNLRLVHALGNTGFVLYHCIT